VLLRLHILWSPGLLLELVVLRLRPGPVDLLALLPCLLGAGGPSPGLALLLPPGHRVAADRDDRRGPEGDPRAPFRGRAEGDPGAWTVVPGSGLSMRLHLHGQSSWLEHEVWGHPWVALGVGSLVVLLLLLVVQLLLELGCQALLLY